MRPTRPTIEARLGAWDVAFRAILETMVRESKQDIELLARGDAINTAATVAATLVIGAELEDGNDRRPREA